MGLESRFRELICSYRYHYSIFFLFTTNLDVERNKQINKKGRDLSCTLAVPRLPCAGIRQTRVTGPTEERGQEAGSLITFGVQTVAAGLDARRIKSSLCSLHAINQTM